MNMDVGNRVYKTIRRPDKALVEQFRNIPSSNIGDMMNRLYCMRHTINRIGRTDIRMLGTAITVKIPDGDNAFIHAALDLAEEGDVLVIDGNGCLTRSLMGEMMFNYAHNRGIAGIVVDGAIRDSDSLQTLPIPVYAAGITPQGPYKNGPGEINIPVSCGGQVVFPGDILVGDADGVVVIHAADAPKIIAAAQKKYEDELERLKCYHTMGNIDAESHNKKFTELMEKLHTTVYQEDSKAYYED